MGKIEKAKIGEPAKSEVTVARLAHMYDSQPSTARITTIRTSTGFTSGIVNSASPLEILRVRRGIPPLPFQQNGYHAKLDEQALGKESQRDKKPHYNNRPPNGRSSR